MSEERLPLQQKFLAGWIILSYVISLFGAFTTLVVLRGRTANRGIKNWILLIGAATSMGVVSIFCMHYVGNHAIVLVDRTAQEQLHYNGGIVFASFVQPICVLLVAFVISDFAGHGLIAWARRILVGTLAAVSVVSMHYCGQIAINNYDVKFETAYVVGSVFIALVATNLALALFFLLRSQWEDSWPRLVGCSMFLAAAVTSMHFTAAVGTSIYEKGGADGQLRSNDYSVIALIVLAFVLPIFLLGYVIFSSRQPTEEEHEHARVSLYSTIFDNNDCIMVHGRHGTLPHREISHPAMDLTSPSIFDTASSLFQWMYRVSADWAPISPLLKDMRAHLKITLKAKKTTDQPNWDLSLIIRERFCLAAKALADSLHISLEEIGTCYEEVLQTSKVHSNSGKADAHTNVHDLESGSSPRLESEPVVDKNQALFLVKHITTDTARHYQALGYAFAPIVNVASSVARAMDVPEKTILPLLHSLSNYRTEACSFTPGFYVSLLSLQVPKNEPLRIMVSTQNRTLLPAAQVQKEELSLEETEYLEKNYYLTLRELAQSACPFVATEEVFVDTNSFHSRLYKAIENLDAAVQDERLLAARLIPYIVQVPCSGPYLGQFAQLALFRLDLPSDSIITTQELMWSTFETFNTEITTRMDRLTQEFGRNLQDEFDSKRLLTLTTRELSSDNADTVVLKDLSGKSTPENPSHFYRAEDVLEDLHQAQKLTWVEDALRRSDGLF